jgi:predicted dehydrogenase
MLLRTMRGNGRHRLGLVGFGKLARDFYVPVLRRHPVEVVSVADPLDASREAAARVFPKAKRVTDPVAVFASEPDAVLAASPPSTHLGLWNEAARRGVRLFLEKPFVLPGELARAAPDPAKLLTVNLNRRFWPPYQQLGAWLREGRIGALRAARFRLHVPVEAWSAVTAHRLDPREGGVLADLGSQMADLAHHWLGALDGALRGSLRPDRAAITLARADGVEVDFDLAYGPRAAEAIALEGDEGTLEIRNPNLAIHYVKPGGRPGVVGALRDAFAVAPRALVRSRSMTRFTIGASLGAFLSGEARPERVGFGEARAHVAFLERVHRELGPA